MISDRQRQTIQPAMLEADAVDLAHAEQRKLLRLEFGLALFAAFKRDLAAPNIADAGGGNEQIDRSVVFTADGERRKYPPPIFLFAGGDRRTRGRNRGYVEAERIQHQDLRCRRGLVP